jgi:DNA-binding LacI/PurR family transcriptional regulator
MSTIKEVADLAGVSIGTVSHVVSGAVPVSDQLRRKVLAAIRTLDYHPNHIARSLKTSKTRTLGIVVPDMTIPFFPKVIRGAEAAARKAGYSIIAVNSDDNAARQKEVMSLLRSQRVEGVLLVIAAGPGSLAQVPKLVASGVPIVYLDRVPDGMEVDSVCVEDCAAADMGVSHLLAAGHKRIAIITGPLALKNEQERLRGDRHALEKAGVRAKDSLIWEGDLNQENVAQLCRERLQNPELRVTALFTTNGVTGLGALRGMYACGLKTPDDIAFVTFDELTGEDLFRPAITAVVQPAYDIGSRATEILLDRITGVNSSRSKVAVRLPATLHVRESSSAAQTAG